MIKDLLPRVYLSNLVEEACELANLISARLKEVTRVQEFEVTQNFQTIVDEVRDAELVADAGLLMARATEAKVIATNAGEIVEAVMVKPLKRPRFDIFAAL